MLHWKILWSIYYVIQEETLEKLQKFLDTMEDYTRLEEMLREKADVADIKEELRRQVKRKTDYSETEWKWYLAKELFDRAVKARHDRVVNDIADSVREAYMLRGEIELFSPVLDALVEEDFDTVQWFFHHVERKMFDDVGLNPNPQYSEHDEITPIEYVLQEDYAHILELLFQKFRPDASWLQLAIAYHSKGCVDHLLTIIPDDDEASKRWLSCEVLKKAACSKLPILQSVTDKIFEGKNRFPGDLSLIPDALTCCIDVDDENDKEYCYPVPVDLPNKLDLLMKYGAVASLPDSCNYLPIELLVSDEVLIPRDPFYNFNHHQHYASVIIMCCKKLLHKMKEEHEEEREILTLLHQLKQAPKQKPTANVVEAQTPDNKQDHELEHEQDKQQAAREASQVPQPDDKGQHQKDYTLSVVPFEIYQRFQDTVIEKVIGQNDENPLNLSNCMSLTKTIDSLLLRYGVNLQGSNILGSFLLSIHVSGFPPVSKFPYINEHVRKLLAYGATVNIDEFMSSNFLSLDAGFKNPDNSKNAVIAPWMSSIVECCNISNTRLTSQGQQREPIC